MDNFREKLVYHGSTPALILTIIIIYFQWALNSELRITRLVQIVIAVGTLHWAKCGVFSVLDVQLKMFRTHSTCTELYSSAV